MYRVQIGTWRIDVMTKTNSTSGMERRIVNSSTWQDASGYVYRGHRGVRGSLRGGEL